MEINDIVFVKVTGIQSYGVFVNYQDYSGLIHISEVSDHYVPDITRIFKVDEFIPALILDIDEDNKRLQLSYKKTLKVHPRVSKQVEIIRGFRSLEEKLDEWIKEHKK